MSDSKSNETMPLVSDFDDHISYLSALIDFHKKTNKGFSLRWLAKKANVSSISYITKVLNGELNLNIKNANKYLIALNVDPAEQARFRYLMNGIKNVDYDDNFTTPENELTKDYIKLLSSRTDFKANENWIYEAMCSYVPIEQIRKSLGELINNKELTLENDQWACKPRNSKLLRPEVTMNAAISSVKGKIVNEISHVLWLPKEEARQLSGEITHFIQRKMAEYSNNTENAKDNNSNNLIVLNYVAKGLTDYT